MHQELCVIVHGFSGNPWEVEPLAHALEQMGYEVMAPLLPGHSIDNERIEKATALDWIQTIEKIIIQAIEDNKKIHMIGFSMGAMIASIMAYRYQLSTLVLLSPSVFVLTPYVLKMKLESFYQNKRENRSKPDPAISFRSTPIYNMFQYQKIVRQAKRIFKHLSIPLCIIHGQKDEIVDPRSSKIIYRAASSKVKELHYLPLSKHHICQGCEVETVIQVVTKFLEKYH